MITVDHHLHSLHASHNLATSAGCLHWSCDCLREAAEAGFLLKWLGKGDASVKLDFLLISYRFPIDFSDSSFSIFSGCSSERHSPDVRATANFQACLESWQIWIWGARREDERLDPISMLRVLEMQVAQSITVIHLESLFSDQTSFYQNLPHTFFLTQLTQIHHYSSLEKNTTLTKKPASAHLRCTSWSHGKFQPERKLVNSARKGHLTMQFLSKRKLIVTKPNNPYFLKYINDDQVQSTQATQMATPSSDPWDSAPIAPMKRSGRKLVSKMAGATLAA